MQVPGIRVCLSRSRGARTLKGRSLNTRRKQAVLDAVKRWKIPSLPISFFAEGRPSPSTRSGDGANELLRFGMDKVITGASRMDVTTIPGRSRSSRVQENPALSGEGRYRRFFAPCGVRANEIGGEQCGLDERQDGVGSFFRGDRLHAAKIQRAFAEKARAAFDLMTQHGACRRAGTSQSRFG